MKTDNIVLMASFFTDAYLHRVPRLLALRKQIQKLNRQKLDTNSEQVRQELMLNLRIAGQQLVSLIKQQIHDVETAKGIKLDVDIRSFSHMIDYRMKAIECRYRNIQIKAERYAIEDAKRIKSESES